MLDLDQLISSINRLPRTGLFLPLVAKALTPENSEEPDIPSRGATLKARTVAMQITPVDGHVFNRTMESIRIQRSFVLGTDPDSRNSELSTTIQAIQAGNRNLPREDIFMLSAQRSPVPNAIEPDRIRGYLKRIDNGTRYVFNLPQAEIQTHSDGKALFFVWSYNDKRYLLILAALLDVINSGADLRPIFEAAGGELSDASPIGFRINR
jgi:hypothetical protein